MEEKILKLIIKYDDQLKGCASDLVFDFAEHIYQTSPVLKEIWKEAQKELLKELLKGVPDHELGQPPESVEVSCYLTEDLLKKLKKLEN